MLKNKDNNNSYKLSNIELEEFLYQQYLTLALEKKALDVKFKELKATCLQLENKDRFFYTTSSYQFQTEDISKLPKELLKIDDIEVRKIYQSALGGEAFLNKYGLTFTTKDKVVFHPKKKGENK